MKQLERRLKTVEGVLGKYASARAQTGKASDAHRAAHREARLAFYDAADLTGEERVAFYYGWSHFAQQAGDPWGIYIYFRTSANALTEEQHELYTQYLDQVARLRVTWWREEIISKLTNSREANAEILEAGRAELAGRLADLKAHTREDLGEAWGLIGDENHQALEAVAVAFCEAVDDLDYQSTYRDIRGAWLPGQGAALFGAAMEKISHAFVSLPDDQFRRVMPVELSDWLFLGRRRPNTQSFRFGS